MGGLKVIYDGDTGGEPENFWFTVRTLERHGVSAVIIEDKVSSRTNTKQLDAFSCACACV